MTTRPQSATGDDRTARWTQITQEADALPASATAGLSTLLDEVADWTPDPARRWWSSMTSWHASEASSWLTGDARRAPEAWVREMLAGAFAPKHSLVRALTLDKSKATATTAARIFESPHLPHLRALDTGRDVKLAPTFYKKLAQARGLGALDTLVYYPRDILGGADLARATNLPALRHLHLRSTSVDLSASRWRDDLAALFDAPWIGRVETIESCLGRNTHWVRTGSAFPLIKRHSARLTSLRRLIACDADDLDDLLAAPVLDQIEELVVHLGHGEMLGPFLARLAARGMPALRRLDLSQQCGANAEKRSVFRPMSPAALRRAIDGNALAAQVRELVIDP